MPNVVGVRYYQGAYGGSCSLQHSIKHLLTHPHNKELELYETGFFLTMWEETREPIENLPKQYKKFANQPRVNPNI